MESSRLFDSGRDSYPRRQTPSLQFSTNLSSGQAYYTLESLEGASSIPLVKAAGSAPFAPERDALLRLDAQTRDFLADRESLDARARLIASERDAILERSLPRPAPTDPRWYVGARPDGLPPADVRLPPAIDARFLSGPRLDGLPPVDAGLPAATDARFISGARLDGLPPVDTRLPPAIDARFPPPVDSRLKLDRLPSMDSHTRLSFDELQTLDPRSRPRPNGLDARLHTSLRSGADSRLRAPQTAGALSGGLRNQRSLSDLIGARDFSAGTRSEIVPYLPVRDSLHDRRDLGDVRAPSMPLDPSLGQRSVAGQQSLTVRGPRGQPRPDVMLERAAHRPVPKESVRKQNKNIVNAMSSNKKVKTEISLGQSEGWCAVCKLECHNLKTLALHLGGRRHKAAVEAKINQASEEGKSAVAASKADKKRVSETKLETSDNVKRHKTMSESASRGGQKTSAAASTEGQKENVSASTGGQKDTASAATGKLSLKAGPADAKKLNAVDFKKENVKKPAVPNGKDDLPMPVCEVCKIFVTGQKNLESHLKGKRHAARVKELAGISTPRAC